MNELASLIVVAVALAAAWYFWDTIKGWFTKTFKDPDDQP